MVKKDLQPFGEKVVEEIGRRGSGSTGRILGGALWLILVDLLHLIAVGVFVLADSLRTSGKRPPMSAPYTVEMP